MKSRSLFALASFALLGGLFAPSSLRAENIIYPAASGVINVKTAYGAVGDGVTDDTAALASALADNPRRLIYLPDGTYLVSGTLAFAGPSGTEKTILQGQSRDGVVIRLQDNCAGFTSASSPKPVVWTGQASQDRFGNSVRNLTIHTGSGNPGAIGLRYYANNYGECRDVIIRSGDGQGVTGLDTAYSKNNGPHLLKNITVDGFATGIRSGGSDGANEYYGMGQTAENITLMNQTYVGWWNGQQVLAIRKLTATGLNVPALDNVYGSVTLLDATLSGGASASTQPAVKNSQAGMMLVRELTASGYQLAIADPVRPAAGPRVLEWSSDDTVSLNPSGEETIHLPVKEEPELVWETDLSKWANIADYGAKDTSVDWGNGNAAAIQAAIDSGATVVYIPAGKSYRITSSVYLRNNVRLFIGSGGSAIWPYGAGVRFVVDSGNAPVVTYMDLFCSAGTGVQLLHNSSRTLVVRNSEIQGGEFTGSGDVFLSAVASFPLIFSGGQKVWARSLNTENASTNLTVSNASSLWSLGLKTERAATVLALSGGSSAELLGSFIFPIAGETGTTPMVINHESRLSLNFLEMVYANPYATLVQETRSGVTTSLARGATNPPTYGAPYKNAGSSTWGSALVRYNGYVQTTAPGQSVIKDNADTSGIVIVGGANWGTSSFNSPYNGNARFTGVSGDGTLYVDYTPPMGSGSYEVFAYYTASTNRNTATPYEITHAGGVTTVTVNQRLNDRSWVSLGKFNFTDGNFGKVRIKNTPGTNNSNVIVADAVKFLKL